MFQNRVFSHGSNISCADHTRDKKGYAIMNYIQSNCDQSQEINDRNFSIKHNELTSFLDYDTFLNLTRTYHKYYLPANMVKSSPMSLYDAEMSVVRYRQLLSHMGNCRKCCNIETINECKEARGILYPHGEMIKRNNILHFPTRLPTGLLNNSTLNYNCEATQKSNKFYSDCKKRPNTSCCGSVNTHCNKPRCCNSCKR